MDESGLLSVCAIAFLAVMVVLSLEAAIIRLISGLFPARRSEVELVAEAIQQAVESRFPGARVLSVEDVNPAEGSPRAAP